MASLFWTGTPLRSTLNAVTDVQTILTEIIDMLTVQLPVAERWTSLGGGVYKTVPDSAGAYMTIEFIRDSATVLSIKVTDHLSRVIDDASHLIVSGDTVKVYAGANHFAIQTVGVADSASWVSMLDLSPEGQDAHSVRVVTSINYDSVGTGRGNNIGTGRAVNLFTGVAATSASRVEVFGSSAGPSFRFISAGGGEIRSYVPVGTDLLGAAAMTHHAGIAHQMALCDLASPYETDIDVHIDVGVTGKFEVLRRTDFLSCRIAVRVPG